MTLVSRVNIAACATDLPTWLEGSHEIVDKAAEEAFVHGGERPWSVPQGVEKSHRANLAVGSLDETPYAFVGYDRLLADFWAEVGTWTRRRP